MHDFGRYEKRQLALATRLLGGDVATAEDACQEARMEVLKSSRANNEPIQLFWPYLRKATVRACYKRLQNQHRERCRLAKAADRFAIGEAEDPATAAMLADILLTSERLVRRHLTSLHVEIFALRYKEGLQVSAIAAQLSLSVSTVKHHLRAIIALLRQALRP